MTRDDRTRSDDPFDAPTPDTPDSDGAKAPTRGLSSTDPGLQSPPGDGDSIDDFFKAARHDGEPETLFDEHTANRAAPPRELKISREHDGRRLTAGHVINERFEIRACLGAGNVGTVYLVDDLRLKDKKALKLMHPELVDSEEAARRFITEIKMLQRLSHEHIVRIYDYGKTEVGGLSFFTMEYIDGATLSEFLKKKGGKLPLDRSIALFTQILDTLEYAHRRTTHRNLKPVNIMVRKTGKVVLLNFGISTTSSSTGIPTAKQRLGASYYQAPEQNANPELDDRRVDIYSAGVILYQMFTGEIPLGQAKPPSRLNRAVPRALDKVVMRCLAPRAEDRYERAENAKAALQRALQPPSRLKRLLLLLILAAILGGMAWLAFRDV